VMIRSFRLVVLLAMCQVGVMRPAAAVWEIRGV